MSRYSLFVLILALTAVAAFQTIARASAPAVGRVSTGEQLVVAQRSADAVMNAHHEGPPQPLELDFAWLAIEIAAFSGLLLKTAGVF